MGGSVLLGDGLSGLIDQVRIYNYARTPAQIAWEYNKGKPIAQWKFDEDVSGNGQTLHDESGNGNHGTTDDGANNTGMDCTVDGKFGKGCEFDGVDDYVSVGNNSLFNFSNNFSLSIWYRRSSSSGHGSLIERGLDGAGGYRLGIGTGGCSSSQINFSKFYIDHYCVGSVPADTEWHNLLVVVDSTNGITTYVDGRYNSNDSHTSNITSSNQDLSLGKWTDESSFQLDDARIYNYPLTQSQVQQVVNEGAGIRF
jgi:hypothetical protein